MRLPLALLIAQSAGLFRASEAFAPASLIKFQLRPTTILRADAADDEVPSDDVDGAELSDDMKEKLKEEDETFGGGSRFKAMMEKAQAGATASPRSLKNPFAENPFAGIEGLDPAASPASAPLPTAFDSMTVEQQAELFRAMMQGQQMAPPAPGPTRTKPDRKVGRNRDADAIQNTSDVYFAQLKRDSTVRGIARIRGDDEKANAVFQDEKIEELKNMISENPHLAYVLTVFRRFIFVVLNQSFTTSPIGASEKKRRS